MDSSLKTTVVGLKRELRVRGFKVTGNKRALAKRLQFAMKMDAADLNIKSRHGAKMKKCNRDDDTHSKQSSVLLTMPVEMLEYIFDYLDIEDLGALSKTCKRMQQLASHCYQQNYCGLQPYFYKIEGHGNVEIRRFRYGQSGRALCIDVEHFIPFFDKIEILPYKNHPGSESLCKFIDMRSEFHQLKMLIINSVDFTNIQIDNIKEVLGNLEHLDMQFCRANDEFIENLFTLTPNVKRLILYWCNIGNNWQSRHFPKLEHCEIVGIFVPVTTFLKHNRNVRNFGMNVNNLQRNMHLIKAENIKLEIEDLSVMVRDGDYANELELHSFWKLLDDHRQLRTYKRLNLHYELYDKRFNQKQVDGLSHLSEINRLRLKKNIEFDYVSLSSLVNLKDISFPDSSFITDIDIVVTRLVSLKRIHFGQTNLKHLEMIMSANLRLQEIQVDWFVNEAGEREKFLVIDLVKLNKQRSKRSNVKKITLFVQAPVYLATKWVNRDTTDLEFVKLKRTESLNERNFDFEYPLLY